MNFSGWYLRVIRRIQVIGADVVELNPERDWMGMTARVAAKCLKEILGRMIIEKVNHK